MRDLGGRPGLRFLCPLALDLGPLTQVLKLLPQRLELLFGVKAVRRGRVGLQVGVGLRCQRASGRVQPSAEQSVRGPGLGGRFTLGGIGPAALPELDLLHTQLCLALEALDGVVGILELRAVATYRGGRVPQNLGSGYPGLLVSGGEGPKAASGVSLPGARRASGPFAHRAARCSHRHCRTDGLASVLVGASRFRRLAGPDLGFLAWGARTRRPILAARSRPARRSGTCLLGRASIRRAGLSARPQGSPRVRWRLACGERPRAWPPRGP